MQHIKLFEEFLSETHEYFKGLSKATIAKKKAQMKKQAEMEDDDPDAYKEMPGDAKGKKTQKVSKFTKKYHEMFGESEDYCWEAEDEDLVEVSEEQINEESIDSPEIEKALKKKSEKTGISIGILRSVMRRGMAAWKSGHRPGAGQVQWGYARVNSFATKGKGTWGNADKDLAKKVRDKK